MRIHWTPKEDILVIEFQEIRWAHEVWIYDLAAETWQPRRFQERMDRDIVRYVKKREEIDHDFTRVRRLTADKISFARGLIVGPKTGGPRRSLCVLYEDLPLRGPVRVRGRRVFPTLAEDRAGTICQTYP